MDLFPQVFPACLESFFSVTLAWKKDSGQARMTPNANVAAGFSLR
jgi:hypothetical protein